MTDLESNFDNGINLWSNLLKDVKEKSSKTAHVPISLLVLGNAGSGKSTLIARLQKSDPKHGSGLEFDYIEIKDESIDENKKLNIWISSGDPYHANLLKYALNESNFGYSCCMITVSLSEPWNIIDNLEEWLKILKMHIERLKLTDSDIKFYKESLIRQFQEYSEPDLEKEKQINLGKRRDNDFNYLHPSVTDDSEKYFVPLEEEILENNLGIPIIVVITKTDSIFTLEQEHDYNDDKFDFIQMHLRKICLKYGATLCYTSLKDDRNCDLLLNYLLHRCYGFSLINTASVIEKDAIFIPTGWDSGKKINILTDNLSDDIKGQSYSSLITKPLSIVRANAQNRLTEPEIAEDEQVFLMKQQYTIQRNKSSASVDGNIKDATKMGPTMNLSNNRNRKNLPSSSGTIGNTSNTSAQQANEGVLANFFSSLLNKRGVTTGSPTLNQQSNSCEILRGDESISENDEYQRDDLSSNSQTTSIVNNQDSTQLKMTETCDNNNQGKIDTSIDQSKCDYTIETLNVDQNRINIETEESTNYNTEENNSHILCDDNIKNEDNIKDFDLEANSISTEKYNEISEFKISGISDSNELDETKNTLLMCSSTLNFENNTDVNEDLSDDMTYKDKNNEHTADLNEFDKKNTEFHNISEQTKLDSEIQNSLESETNVLDSKDIEITDMSENTQFNDTNESVGLKNIVSDKDGKNLEIINDSINTECTVEDSIKQEDENFSNTSKDFKNNATESNEIIMDNIEVNACSSKYETNLMNHDTDIECNQILEDNNLKDNLIIEACEKIKIDSFDKNESPGDLENRENTIKSDEQSTEDVLNVNEGAYNFENKNPEPVNEIGIETTDIQNEFQDPNIFQEIDEKANDIDNNTITDGVNLENKNDDLK